MTTRYHAAMVYYEQQTPPEKEPAGCLDVLLIMRAMFALLFWPAVGLAAVVADIVVIVVLFGIQPALALIPVCLTAFGIWWYARWEQRHFRPPDA